MSDEPETDGPTREELLDNSPEAVAMRRARALRAEARAKAEAAQAEEEPSKPGSLRRKLLIGGVLGLATAARVLAKVNRTSRTR